MLTELNLNITPKLRSDNQSQQKKWKFKRNLETIWLVSRNEQQN